MGVSILSEIWKRWNWCLGQVFKVMELKWKRIEDLLIYSSYLLNFVVTICVFHFYPFVLYIDKFMFDLSSYVKSKDRKRSIEKGKFVASGK